MTSSSLRSIPRERSPLIARQLLPRSSERYRRRPPKYNRVCECGLMSSGASQLKTYGSSPGFGWGLMSTFSPLRRSCRTSPPYCHWL